VFHVYAASNSIESIDETRYSQSHGGPMRKWTMAVAFCVATAAFASGDSGTRYVVNIHVEGSQFVAISALPAFANPDSCGTSDMAVIRPGDPGYKEVVAIATTALMAEKQIRFWLAGCVGTPWGVSAPLIYSISITR
jgi:hypothetical protein